MKRSVALKVINPQLLQNSAAVERFQREVQAAAKLAHPNLVAAYDAEQAADTHFLVMEYVSGEDLSALVEKQGRLPISTACAYVRQAALGLAQARERGMVHRDIKPQNLILTSGGQVKILDFGLAQFASEIAEQSGLTQAGAVMGTPDYMAPEQARDAHSADIRADIYSLGCTLYCLLTGRPPFTESATLGKIMAHIEREPVTELCDGVPPELQIVLRKMMAKDPTDRYQTPAEVAAALAPFAPSGSESTRAILPTSSPAVSGRRLPFTPLAIAVLVGLAFLGVFGGIIVVVTDRGQIEIQSEVDDVDVMVTQGVNPMSRVKSCLLMVAGVLCVYVCACSDRPIKADEGRHGCMSFKVGTLDGVGALLFGWVELVGILLEAIHCRIGVNCGRFVTCFPEQFHADRISLSKLQPRVTDAGSGGRQAGQVPGLRHARRCAGDLVVGAANLAG